MELQDAVRILSAKKIISEPTKARVKVSTCSMLSEPQARGNGIVVDAIANFRAMNPYQYAQAKAMLADGDIDGALKQGLSLGLRQGIDYHPAKGETVDVELEYITTKSGEQALLVTSITAVKAETNFAKADFSQFLESTNVEVEEGDLTAEG